MGGLLLPNISGKIEPEQTGWGHKYMTWLYPYSEMSDSWWSIGVLSSKKKYNVNGEMDGKSQVRAL